MERLAEAIDRLPQADTAADDAAPPPPASPPLTAPPGVDPERWVLGGPTLSRRLLPLLAARPDLLAPGEGSRAWV